MSMKYLAGLPIAALALSPILASVNPAPAQAAATNYTCTAQTWTGEALPTITVYPTTGKKRQAQGLAQTQWGGDAKFATIDCKPNN